MLKRTHLSITLLISLLLIKNFANPLLTIITALISTIIPDIDSQNSKIGKRRISKIITAFSKHRGFFHSFLFIISVFIFLNPLSKPISQGFILGYSLHLFSDMFTKRGIKPFYPLKLRIKGPIKSGGIIESITFIILTLSSIVIIVKNILGH